MDKLKSCPFCGGEAKTVEIGFFFDTESSYGIKCNRCHACSSMRCGSEEEAIEAWNRRVDTVEVVMCKDCIKRNTEECAMWYEDICDDYQYSWESDDDYCSWGVRRKEDE